jgi:hypothetical protein
MIEHPIQWTAPSPLWLAAANAGDPLARRTLRQPAILRFSSDTFMEDFLAMLQSDPMQLTKFVAQPETWRGPTAATSVNKPLPGLRGKLNRLRLAASRNSSTALTTSSGSANQLALSQGATQQASLKLYQPAHQRYYLVTACFVCRLAGLPDRVIDPAKQERATYVVRRLFPPGGPQSNQPITPCNAESCEEYALVTTASGAGWQKVSGANGPATLVSGEEQLPLFPSYFTEDDGHRRRLLAGLIPVGKREAYMGAAQLSSEGAMVPATSSGGGSSSQLVDPRMMLLWSQVTEPWKRLTETASRIKKSLTGVGDAAPKASEAAALTKQTREQLQMLSWYVLLDFAKLLEQYIPNVWALLTNQTPQSTVTTGQTDLLAALTATTINQTYVNNLRTGTPYADAAVARTLSAALVRVRGGLPLNAQAAAQLEQKLESVTVPYNRSSPDAAWPSFLFPLADPVEDGPKPPPKTGVPDDPNPLKALSKRIDNLSSLFEQALPALQATEQVPASAMASQPVFDTREGWFRIRCVFERPLCGVLEPPVLSEPSKPFQMAGFFDPDAPARPIRIALPIDTSPAGLRKFDKNTAFMISDVLCGQIDRMKGITLGDLVLSVLPWPLHKDLPVPEGGPCKDDSNLQVGMICSLSIPIITICALLLLMIIVFLLDIIFKWIPFFLICFPLPGFKAKSQS